MRKLIILILLLTQVGCNNSTVKLDNVEFPIEEQGAFEIIADSIMMSGFYGLYVYNDNLLVIALSKDGKLCHLFNKSTGDYISSSVKVGRANNEITFMFNYYINKENNELKIYDQYCLKTFKISNDIVSYINTSEVIKAPYPTSIYELRDNYKLVHDHYHHIDNGHKRYRFALIKDDAIVSSYNIRSYSENDEAYEFAYEQAPIAISDNRKRFAIGSLYGGIIEFFSYEDGKINNICKRHYINPKPREDFYDVAKGYKFSSNDKFVISPYNKLQVSSVPTQSIAIFDWDGNPQKLINTNQRIMVATITDFDIIYALVETDLGYAIAKINA